MSALQVALLSTARADRPGSMMTYERLLERVLEPHGDRVATSVVRLGKGGMKWEERFKDLLSSPRRYLRRTFDVFHLLDGSQAVHLFGLPRDRTVVTVHDMIPHLQAERVFPVAPPGAMARFLLAANRRAIARAATICAVSQCSALDCERLTGHRAASVVPLPLPRTLDSVNDEPRSRDRSVLHIGNNGFYKNRVGAVRCFGVMQSKAPDLELVLLGPEPNSDVLAAIAELNRPEAVHLVVDPPDDVVDSALASAGVLLFPSLYEGYGWPPLEAMHAGCPVVSSDRGSLAEVVGEGGVLCDPDDVEGFADAALALLDDGPGRRAHVARGRARVDMLDDSQFANSMIELYEAVARSAVPIHRAGVHPNARGHVKR